MSAAKADADISPATYKAVVAESGCFIFVDVLAEGPGDARQRLLQTDELGPVHAYPRRPRCACTTLRAGALCPHRVVAARSCTVSTLRSRRLALRAKHPRRDPRG